MTLSYNLKDINSSIPENLKSFALYFKDNNSVINNNFLPITYDKYEKGYMFGCGNYSSQNISFIGDIFKYLDIKQVRGIFIDGNIDQFKINSSRFSVVYDNNGKTVIFYEDEDSNNISVAFSFDNGASWVRNKDIIRLTKNETASSPLAVLDQNTGYVNLFYCLNGVFLMLSIIDPKLFSLKDVFVEYIPPLTYDEYTTDNNNIESSSLFKYSENGKLLRKTSSYFVYGNQTDPYFQEQLKIYNSMRDKELFSTIPPRFIFSSDNSFLNSEFTDFSYSFCIDKSGVKRLFIIKEGKLTILSSGDFISWSIDIEGKEFHKDYLLDSENKGKTYEIKNLQVIRNYYDDDNLGLLYFYNSMMFVRFLDAKELKNKANLDNYLSISKGNLSNPLFLVGKLDEELKSRKIIEIQNDTLYQDSDVPIFFPDNYLNEEILNSFDENFDVDVDTQPYGITSKNGISSFIINFGFVPSHRF